MEGEKTSGAAHQKGSGKKKNIQAIVAGKKVKGARRGGLQEGDAKKGPTLKKGNCGNIGKKIPKKRRKKPRKGKIWKRGFPKEKLQESLEPLTLNSGKVRQKVPGCFLQRKKTPLERIGERGDVICKSRGLEGKRLRECLRRKKEKGARRKNLKAIPGKPLGGITGGIKEVSGRRSLEMVQKGVKITRKKGGWEKRESRGWKKVSQKETRNTLQRRVVRKEAHNLKKKKKN